MNKFMNNRLVKISLGYHMSLARQPDKSCPLSQVTYVDSDVTSCHQQKTRKSSALQKLQKNHIVGYEL